MASDLNRAAPLERTPDGGVFVPSSLWIDQDDVWERLEEKNVRGEISDELAGSIAFFVENGYLVFRLDADPAIFDEIQSSVDRFWREKPADLVYAYDGPARRMTHAEASRDRRSRYRIHDIHSHSSGAMALYLHRQIFDMVDLIFGEEGVAIQSLYFEYGSQQLLHRDPVVVPISEPGHLVAAWIALEDISPDCGPLVYVPGSHRLPYFELAPGEYKYDARRMGPEVVEKGMAWEEEQQKRHGLEARHLTIRQGEALLWHGSLRHGGAEVKDERLTRKSFVVHYTSRRTYDRRSIGIAEPENGGDRWRVLETREILEENGCRGFQNPMLGYEA